MCSWQAEQKASGGGGGRGMQVVRSVDDLMSAIDLTRLEAKQAFNNDAIYMEKYLERPRHIEIQVLCDRHGNAVYLGERDCSVQRRHQKIIEESPAPGIGQQERQRIGEQCVKACQKLGYVGAGTFEFLYQDNQFYFIEMNTRIQVEHPVTEMVTGIDLVKEQLRIASGEVMGLTQDMIEIKGHAIECRINAENPKTLLPSPGQITMFHPPGGPGVRFDSHLYSGYRVPHYYDSLIAKLICYGDSRDNALKKMEIALSETIIEGISTNTQLHSELVACEPFVKGGVTIHFLEKEFVNAKV